MILMNSGRMSCRYRADPARAREGSRNTARYAATSSSRIGRTWKNRSIQVARRCRLPAAVARAPGAATAYWNHRCRIALTIAHNSQGLIRRSGGGTAIATYFFTLSGCCRQIEVRSRSSASISATRSPRMVERSYRPAGASVAPSPPRRSGTITRVRLSATKSGGAWSNLSMTCNPHHGFDRARDAAVHSVSPLDTLAVRRGRHGSGSSHRGDGAGAEQLPPTRERRQFSQSAATLQWHPLDQPAAAVPHALRLPNRAHPAADRPCLRETAGQLEPPVRRYAQ